jgi:PTEN phosphatase family protein
MMASPGESRMRTWSEREVTGGYIQMPEDPQEEEISIVADPDKQTNKEDDTLDNDDFDDEFEESDDVTSPFGDAGFKERPRTELTFREKLMRAVNSIWWQGIVVLLILADVVLFILQLVAFYGHSQNAKDLNRAFGQNGPLTDFGTAIVVVLLVEVLIRVIILGRFFWKDALNIFDLIVMVISFILMLVVENTFARSLVVILRFVRVGTRLVRLVIKIIQGKRALNKAVRHVVTENKMRYTKDGWDLDLAYITDRIMVSSLPAFDYQALYRNHIDDMVRFLDTMHGQEGYTIVNCCAENYANYPVTKFYNRVKRFYIMDHNTGTLQQLLEACQHMEQWHNASPNNVVLVHCKGGKGRSGSVICAYLLYSGVCSSADEALDLFAHKRTDPTKPGRLQGVETASQRRYVEYFSAVVRAGRVLPAPIQLRITKLSVKLVSPDNLRGLYQLAPFATVTHNDGEPVDNHTMRGSAVHESYTAQGPSAEYAGLNAMVVNDVRLMVFLEEKNISKKTGKRREIYFFYFWFHTAFVTTAHPLILSKHEVDRNRKWKKSPFGKLKSLTVEVHFSLV